MQRVLNFGTDYARANRRYALMQQAMMLAAPGLPDGQTGRHYLRSTDVMRREAAVLDALDSVSEPDESVKDNPSNVPARRLRKDAQALVFSQPELDLLRERVDPTRMIWLPSVAGDVVRLIDWIDGAERVEAERCTSTGGT